MYPTDVGFRAVEGLLRNESDMGVTNLGDFVG